MNNYDKPCEVSKVPKVSTAQEFQEFETGLNNTIDIYKSILKKGLELLELVL